MSFTDSDLKRLKENLFAPTKVHIKEDSRISRSQLFALLARLEAAEQYAETHGCETHSYNGCPELEAWEKACGK